MSNHSPDPHPADSRRADPSPFESPPFESPPADSRLLELAAAYGIADSFVDWKGRHTAVPESTLRAVLRALDVPAADAGQVAQALVDRRDAPWRRMLPPCLVVIEGESVTFPVHVVAGDPVRVWVELEAGGVGETYQVDNWEPDRPIDGVWTGEASFTVPADLPLGYHRVCAESHGKRATSTVIVTPRFLGFPERIGPKPLWGLATQLYSVRSADSWGVGDLVDLTDLAVWSAVEQDAGYILINPLHAVEPTVPLEPSPYFPASRRFVNPLYLRVERIPEYASLPASARKHIQSRQTKLAQHAGAGATGPIIDRDAAWIEKEQALRTVYAGGRTRGRDFAFRAYCDREGPDLMDFATWCALARALGSNWREWPGEYRDPRSSAVQQFRDENIEDIDFGRWLQWCLDEQLRTAQAEARAAGMPLGIIHDLAVGVSGKGADAWALGNAFADGVTVGAPPDQYTQLGQDWGQPPLRPDRLEELAYRPFRDMVRAVLRHAGGIRVDHIIGLFRLWWVPEGGQPTAGTYVRYNHRAMIGVLALEAHRAGALVIGEDLGTVEPSARKLLRERGILGTSILWFEQDWSVPGGDPLPPESWREYCLASVTTHDLPPTTGYLLGDHVRLRDSLGLLVDDLETELARDHQDREQWLRTLRDQGLLAAGEESVESVVQALHAFLRRTPARLLNLALTDAVGDRRTQNQPGTIDEYPNWRIPLSGPDGRLMRLEEIFSDPHAARLCRLMSGREPLDPGDPGS